MNRPMAIGIGHAFVWALLLSAVVGRAQEPEKQEEQANDKEPVAAPEPKAVAPEGLRLENVTVAPRDAATATVTFDLRWSCSWRYGVFHDAAWIFFKMRADEKQQWQHVRLQADQVLSPAGYGQAKDGTPLEFVVPDGQDGFTGLIVRRGADGVGSVAARKITAVCDLQALKDIPDIAKAQICAFGVEMVYVPEGPFFVGQGAEEPFPSAGYGFGGMEQNWIYQFTRKDGRDFISTFKYSALGYVDLWTMITPEDRLPSYPVTSAGPIPTGRQQGRLWALNIKPEDDGQIPAAFPNGFAAFYCMKFPRITQGQYAAFLNTLTPAQAKLHYWREGHGSAIKGKGDAVKRSGKSPNHTYSATEPDGWCPWISWADAMAYAAWAGLRPMTELEYEKAVRGPELAAPNDANPSYWGVNGVQENQVYERDISIGDARGRAFAGTHGPGTLELPADWPPTYLEGVIFRGDYFLPAWSGNTFTPSHQLISGRTFPIYARSDRSNAPYAGWRGARSAPPPKGSAIARQAGVDTAMTPFFRKNADQEIHLARMKQPMRPDGVLDEWAKPLLILDEPSTLYPTHLRFFSGHDDNPWRGPEDMSVRVHLGWDGEALCVAAEVKDDVQYNMSTATSLWEGDAMQVGLIDAEASQTSVWLALTTTGVLFQPWRALNKNLSKTAKYEVARDEAAKTTRYELRLPLADIGLKPGVKCYYYFMFLDSDGKEVRYRFQWAPIVTEPFNARRYSKFVMDE